MIETETLEERLESLPAAGTMTYLRGTRDLLIGGEWKDSSVEDLERFDFINLWPEFNKPEEILPAVVEEPFRERNKSHLPLPPK